MALTVAKTCTKVGIAGGAVYWSIQQGVWGTAQEGSQAMKRFTANVLPPDTEIALPKLESFSNNESFIRSSWNQGTRTVFEYVRDIPEYAGKAKTAVMDFVEDSFRK